MRKTLICAVLSLVVACSSKQLSLGNTGQSPQNVAPKQVNLTDADLEVLRIHLEEWGGEDKETREGPLRRLEVIAPGWAERSYQLVKVFNTKCSSLVMYSRSQRMNARIEAGTHPPSKEELKNFEDAVADCKAIEGEALEHRRWLGEANADRVDIQTLLAIVQIQREPGSTLDPLLARFPKEPQVWAWQARLGDSAKSRLEAAHRCLSLDANYPKCVGLYDQAAADYRRLGCQQVGIRAGFRIFGASKKQGGDFQILIEYEGESYYREESPSLEATDFTGVWHDRNWAGGYDFVTIQITKAGQNKLLAATKRLTNKQVVFQLGQRALEVATVLTPVVAETLTLSDWTQETRKGFFERGVTLFDQPQEARKDPEQFLVVPKPGRIPELCHKVEQRKIPEHLVWNPQLNR